MKHLIIIFTLIITGTAFAQNNGRVNPQLEISQLKDEALVLHRELRQTQRLLANAQNFHQNNYDEIIRVLSVFLNKEPIKKELDDVLKEMIADASNKDKDLVTIEDVNDHYLKKVAIGEIKPSK